MYSLPFSHAVFQKHQDAIQFFFSLQELVLTLFSRGGQDFCPLLQALGQIGSSCFGPLSHLFCRHFLKVAQNSTKCWDINIFQLLERWENGFLKNTPRFGWTCSLGGFLESVEKVLQKRHWVSISSTFFSCFRMAWSRFRRVANKSSSPCRGAGFDATVCAS